MLQTKNTASLFPRHHSYYLLFHSVWTPSRISGTLGMRLKLFAPASFHSSLPKKKMMIPIRLSNPINNRRKKVEGRKFPELFSTKYSARYSSSLSFEEDHGSSGASCFRTSLQPFTGFFSPTHFFRDRVYTYAFSVSFVLSYQSAYLKSTIKLI